MSLDDFDACTHPPGITWTEELARAIKNGDKVRIVLDGRFTKVESREVDTFRSDGGAELPMLRHFITFKPVWSDDYIDLDTTPPWKDAP